MITSGYLGVHQEVRSCLQRVYRRFCQTRLQQQASSCQNIDDRIDDAGDMIEFLKQYIKDHSQPTKVDAPTTG
jgi:hypothetical protein